MSLVQQLMSKRQGRIFRIANVFPEMLFVFTDLFSNSTPKNFQEFRLVELNSCIKK